MKSITKKRLILASQSPRRRELLTQAGLEFEIVPADIQEIMIPSESPDDYVKRLSREKAQFVAQKFEDLKFSPDTILNQIKDEIKASQTIWVLGADTTVVMGSQILEKPTSKDDAKFMLKTLSGNVHTVYTGFTLCCQSENRLITNLVKTDVLFKELTDKEIDWYVATDEPFDKAGAYAIQGLGAFMVKSINGSYSNVVGLPVCEVVDILIKENVIKMD
ncbi:MAG: septum formation inhibitor Maf [Desulfamplus sp.]|nr:septum formation inhibitor Maf [Desulfamplus sp.]